MIKKTSSDSPELVRVTFTLPPAIWAETVHLSGDFNNWSKTSHPLIWDRQEEVWTISLTLPKGREFQFRYLVNGCEWHNDWQADHYLPNPFGGDNSVVVT